MSKFALFAMMLAFCGCSSSEDDPGGSSGSAGGSGGTGMGGSGGTGGTGGIGGTGDADASVPDATPDSPTDSPVSDTLDESEMDAPADVAQEVGPVSSCDELGTTSCFANHECEAAQRCENAGTDLDPVPCCVPGPRGTGQAGELCMGEKDCESGVCITGSGDGMCSKVCEDSSECPDGMKQCIYLAFSGSDDMWCFPTN